MQYNCDGSGPHTNGQVRVLRTSKEPFGSNLHLCHACFNREIAWRRQRNQELGQESHFDLPVWTSLKVYDPV